VSNVVELTLLANDKASSVVNGVTGAVRSLVGQFMAMAGLTAGAAGLGALVKQGIEFNKVMEDSKAGIASLILANNTLTDSTGKALGPAASLNQAFKIAAGVQADLRAAALTTAASYQELVKGFQTAYGPASAAGITSMSKIREITVSASQAVAALGLDSRQTSQELRALFTGEQGPDNTLTRTLGITKAEIDRVRASGEDLGDFLISKLKPFADVAAQSMGNFSTVLSNLGDVVDQVMGEAFAPFFREIKAQASGMGGALGGLESGLGAIGQGLADALRALGPLVQALAGLGVAAVKAGTDFLSAFAPIVPALTATTNAVTAVVDSLGTVGLTAVAGGLAFTKLSALASAGLYKIIGATAATDTAVTALIGTVSLATVGWAALALAVAGAVGWLVKWNYEAKADEAWKRAADAQVKYIEVLERKYRVTVEANAAEELLNVTATGRAAVMERVLKLDKDGIVTQDEVRAAMAAMTEETMKAKNAASAFADMQAKTKEKYQDLLAALKAEVRIGGLEGLKKDLAVVAEEFRKKRDEIRKTFFDAGSGQWAQDPKALLGFLGIKEGKKMFTAKPVEAFSLEVKKQLDKVKTYVGDTGKAVLKTWDEVRADMREKAEDILHFFSDSAGAGVEAGWLTVLAGIPTAAESAANAVRDVWSGMARSFDDLFFNVLSGRLDSLKDVFKNLWESILQTASRYFSDLLQRWLKTQMAMGDTGYTGKAFNVTNYGVGGSTTATGTGATGDGGWGGAVAGAGIGYGVGQFGNGKYNAIGATMGGAIGGVALAGVGAKIGGTALSFIPGVGTIIGALIGAVVGLIIGAILSPDTEKHIKGSIANMGGGTRQTWVDPWEEVGPRGRILDSGGGYWQDEANAPTSSFEREGFKVIEAQTASMADLFKLGAKDQARELLASYTTALRAALKGATVDIAAGSDEDLQGDYEFFLKTMLPRIGLSAAFGQVGYLPHGNRDKTGGQPGIDWWAPGMDKEGAWLEKQLYDPEAPIPKMLAGLGFTSDAIGALAKRISTDDPAKLLTYIQGIVGFVVRVRELGTEMGKTFSELVQGFADETAAGPAAAFGKIAADVATLFEDLTLYSGDEQLAKAQEAGAAAEEVWGRVVTYVKELAALADKLSAGLQGMRVGMRDFLNPLTEGEANAANWSKVDSTWGKLYGAKDAATIEAATNEAAAAIEALFNVMAERVTRGKALVERLTGLSGDLWDLSSDVAGDRLEKSSPLAAMKGDLLDIQRDVAEAARKSGLEQIQAIEDVADSAEDLYGKLRTLLSDIASVSESINKSIDSQIWELGVGELDPTGQASAVGQRIKELQDQLALATAPAEIQAITSEIQSLMSRYMGQFGQDDSARADAVTWAQEQLERTRGLANAALEAMRAEAEAQAKELQGILKGAAVDIAGNVAEASTIIGQLSFTLNELDRVMREVLEGLGQAAIDALGPLKAAMETAAGIFTGATQTAATALLEPETGLSAATERSTARLNSFAEALDRATSKLDGIGGGTGAKTPTTVSINQTTQNASVTAREVIPLVRRHTRSLTPRVA
jgi:hypothetical protein